MQEIEHAIHTSAKTECNEGYQIVAQSTGISAADARELAMWCPSHGSILPDAVASGGVSAFRLANGSQYVAKTTVVGEEYSNRGGRRLVTHCLKIPDGVFRRFANSPFSLLNAAVAGGYLDPSHAQNQTLDPFPLVGRAKALDRGLLRDAFRRLGSFRLHELLQAGCAGEQIGIAGGQESAVWMATVLNLLPVATRPDATFTAGLRPTSCRPVRWSSVDGDDAQLNRQLKRKGVKIFECRPAGNQVEMPDDSHVRRKDESAGWAAFVIDCLARQTIDELESAIENENAPTRLEELGKYTVEFNQLNGGGMPTADDVLPSAECDEPTPPCPDWHADPAQDIEAPNLTAPYAMRLEAGAVLEHLELLDDTIFAAINGDAAALVQSEARWREIVAALGTEMVEESREQYLRYANDVWTSSRDGGRIGPDQAAAALEIIAMLTG